MKNTWINLQLFGVYMDYWASSESNKCKANWTLHYFSVFKRKWKIQKNWCAVTVAPTIEHHGGHSRTPANQSWTETWVSNTSYSEKNDQCVSRVPRKWVKYELLDEYNVDAEFPLRQNVSSKHSTLLFFDRKRSALRRHTWSHLNLIIFQWKRKNVLLS